ncbi:MAG: OsmC family protein [Gammaproteobacteria bacterium]|nr:OsmC family protein [Gammaproteobacteria bacterium]
METHRHSLRLTAGNGAARAYVRKCEFRIGAPLTFDENDPNLTACDYLLGAAAGELVTGLDRLARRRRLTLDRIEAVLHAELAQPLAALGTVGEQGVPRFVAIRITLYVDTLEDPAGIHALWHDVLCRSPIYQTLRACVAFEPRLELT